MEAPVRPAQNLEISGHSVRWDIFPKFPPAVPTAKLWEEWQRFYDDFKMTATLCNAKDPYQLCQVLQLSLGERLKSIVRAAGLIPVVNTPGCYEKLVKEIGEYLFGMTDSDAAHDNFTKMKQNPGESIVEYHARVVGMVELCNYQAVDRNRFVRTQLITGMTNRKMAEKARTHRYTAAEVLQLVSRIEAMTPSGSSIDPEVMAVAQQRPDDRPPRSHQFNDGERFHRRGMRSNERVNLRNVDAIVGTNGATKIFDRVAGTDARIATITHTQRERPAQR